MLSALALNNQRIIATQMAHLAAKKENQELLYVSLRAAYSCNIALMMMEGNLDELPVTE